MSGRVLLSSLAALACACAPLRPATRPGQSPPLTAASSPPPALDPWDALSALDERCQEGTARPGNEDPLAQITDVPGRFADVSWDYIAIGRGFVARESTAEATLAFRAAARHARTAIASQAERARIRKVAYHELATLAAAAGRPRRAALLRIPEALARDFLSTPAARQSDEEFERLADDVARGLEAGAQEQGEGGRSLACGALCAGARWPSAVTSPVVAVAAGVTAAAVLMALSKDHRGASAGPAGTPVAYLAARASDDLARTPRAGWANDSADDRFLAAEIVTALAEPGGVEHYGERIELFASESPEAVAALASARAAHVPSREVLDVVFSVFDAMETDADHPEPCGH